MIYCPGPEARKLGSVEPRSQRSVSYTGLAAAEDIRDKSVMKTLSDSRT